MRLREEDLNRKAILFAWLKSLKNMKEIPQRSLFLKLKRVINGKMLYSYSNDYGDIHSGGRGKGWVEIPVRIHFDVTMDELREILKKVEGGD